MNSSTKKNKQYLLHKDPKPGRFYILPKIDKVNNPGRRIVSSNNHPTERISQFVYFHLKLLVCTIPSYVKDSTDFLNQLNAIDNLYFILFYLLSCHTQWITSRIKTIINRLINIKFKICTLLGRSDCGGEISEKPSLWGIEIFPHGQFKY